MSTRSLVARGDGLECAARNPRKAVEANLLVSGSVAAALPISVLAKRKWILLAALGRSQCRYRHRVMQCGGDKSTV